MKNRMFVAMGIGAVAVLAIFVVSLYAQTTAVGPYYAMPAWDQTLACSSVANCPRFIVLSNFAGAAVLDRETGLVWERSPAVIRKTWGSAWLSCVQQNIGGRLGWRLPSIAEAQSLREGPDNGQLPAGHPFENVQQGLLDLYWTSTRDPFTTAFAFGVTFRPGSSIVEFDTTSQQSYWCVRGGRE